MFQENKRLQNDVHQGSQSDRKFKSLDLIRQKGQPEYYLTDEEKSHYHQALSHHKAKTPEQEFAVYVFDEARNIIKDGHNGISERLQEKRIYYFLKKREKEAYNVIQNKNMECLTDTEKKVLQFCSRIGTILKESPNYYEIIEKVANERYDIINKSSYRDQKVKEEVYRQNKETFDLFQENRRLQNDVHQGSRSDRKFKSLDLICQEGQPEYYLTEEEKSHYHQALSHHKAETPEQEFAVYVFDEARNIIKDGHNDISERLQERRIYYFLRKREKEAYDVIKNKNMEYLTDIEEKVLQLCSRIGTILKESSSYHQIIEKVANERYDIINKSGYRDQKAREEIYRQNTVASCARHFPDILSSGGERLSGSLTPAGSHSFLDHRQSSVSHRAKEFINRGDGIEDLPERLQRQRIRFSASQVQSSERPSSTVSRETGLSGAPNSEALKELMKGPDTFTAYGPQTQTLLQDFGKKFPVAEQIIRRNPPAMQLVNEAAKAGVTFSGYAENGPLQMNLSHSKGKRVFIHKGYDPIKTMRNFLMELTNGINHLRSQKLGKQARKGRITKEDYVYKILEIEAEGALKVGEIWYQIKMASKNPTKLDAYDHNFYLEPYLAGHQKGKARMIDTMRTVKQPEGRLTHQEYYQEYYEQNYEKRREWYLSHGYSYRG